jgi:fermentation-respiration switch protein FrsA (DUF1100 family)
VGCMLSVLVTVAVVVGGTFAALILLQGRMVFYPDRQLRATPAILGVPFEEVELATSDGVRIHGWWVPSPEPRGALVFAHGNAGNIGDRLEFVSLFRSLGLSVLLFDYRGYGRSQGSPSEAGTGHDMDAAITFVTTVKGVPLARTIFYGESLGGAVAIAAAARHRPGALVVASTFTSVPDMARVHYAWAPRALVRIRYDSLALMPTLRCPLLVLHGERDGIAPFFMGQALFAAAPAPKRFATLVGDHNDGGLLVSPDAVRALEELLDNVLARQ